MPANAQPPSRKHRGVALLACLYPVFPVLAFTLLAFAVVVVGEASTESQVIQGFQLMLRKGDWGSRDHLRFCDKSSRETHSASDTERVHKVSVRNQPKHVATLDPVNGGLLQRPGHQMVKNGVFHQDDSD